MEGHDDPEDLKLLVRVLRELRGWDQTELATAAGVDASSISHYETGRTVPPRRTLGRLAAAVGLQMSFVQACLLPALVAARAVATPFPGESSDDLERHAVELGRALSGAGRSSLAAFLARLDTADRPPWERAGPSLTEEGTVATDLWDRLKPRSAEERRFLVESCREFQVWALAERLRHESETAVADHAPELARLAYRVAELAAGEEGAVP
jgi:transcriptional regulator with XRE-family HTH domain